jgi:hypothetical protein
VDKTEFKEKLHDALREAGVNIAADWVQSVLVDGDVEDKRKAVALIADILGASDRQEKNPYGNLPVFNITLVNGTAQVTAEPLPPAELVKQEMPVLELLKPVEPAAPPKAPVPLEDLFNDDDAKPPAA